MDARKTRGLKTKEKILHAAATLFHQKGVNGTSVDDVLENSKTGKSQFYHFFGSKEKLVREVLKFHAETFREMRESLLAIESFEQFEQWYQMSLKQALEDEEFYGCPVGMMANELSVTDEELRDELTQMFGRWEEMFARCFACLKAKGELAAKTDPDVLAEFMVATFQGASLLAKTKSDRQVLIRCMGNAMTHLKTFLV